VDFIFPLIASAKELLLVILFFTDSSRGAVIGVSLFVGIVFWVFLFRDCLFVFGGGVFCGLCLKGGVFPEKMGIN